MVKTELHGKHWIAPEIEWSDEELWTVLDVSFDLKRQYAMGQRHDNICKGKSLFTLFFNPSTRTRSSFITGITQLGGVAYDLDPGKLQITHGETIYETAAIMSRMCDGIAIRRYVKGQYYGEGNLTMREYAKASTVPVINMECDMWHPCQGVADIMTVIEKYNARSLRGKKFVMCYANSPGAWKPVAVPQTNIIFFTRLLQMDVTLAYPEKFNLDPAVEEYTKKLADQYGTKFEIVHSMEEAFEDALVVYPKGWCSWELLKAGGYDEKLHEEYKRTHNLAAWKTTPELMDRTRKNSIWMHCLPADVGYEVEPEVIFSNRWSVSVDEAENRLHGQKGIMALTMGGRR
ncbi:MAG: ornithine carbamoyltransferase [Candidatus Methanomethyliales bacterium]|nr:ornithine carbamoyltransferase [Candidatus Methanomethylicales archaeon]